MECVVNMGSFAAQFIGVVAYVMAMPLVAIAMTLVFIIMTYVMLTTIAKIFRFGIDFFKRR